MSALGKSKDKRWDSRLARFAQAYGLELLADRVGVSRDAIYKWISGVVHMRPVHAKKIVALARRRKIVISLDEIYQHFDEVRGALTRKH